MMNGVTVTYCMNVHPGETVADVFRAVSEYAAPVAHAFGHGRFGLGLRLSGCAASGFANSPELLQALQQLMRADKLYACTINAFPYGAFHGTSVKDNVYRPAWNDVKRLNYTKDVCTVLAKLLPDDEEYGSVSTSPPWFKNWGDIPDDCCGMYVEAARFLENLRNRTGRKIVLCIEPEPGCMPETVRETVNFFSQLREHGLSDRLSEYLGVCLDASHQAVEFEKFEETVEKIVSNGIFPGKLHISAALEAPDTKEGRQALSSFDEPVYLHQTVRKDSCGRLSRYTDISEAVSDGEQHGSGIFRSHFHVPLTVSPAKPLVSTVHQIEDGAFAAAACRAGCRHFECETYTWGIWPGADGSEEKLISGIVSELKWAESVLGRALSEHG